MMKPQKVERRFRCIAFAVALAFGLILFFYILVSCYFIYGTEKVIHEESNDWGSLPDFVLCANEDNNVKWAFYYVADYSTSGGFNATGGSGGSFEEAVRVSLFQPEGTIASYSYESCVRLSTSSLSPYFTSQSSAPSVELEFSYQPGSCEDANGAALDMNGNDCSYYWESTCVGGASDDADFVASTMCCACGGGGWSPGLTAANTVTSFDLLSIVEASGTSAGSSQWLASVRPFSLLASELAENGVRIEKLRRKSGLFTSFVTETYQVGSTNLEYFENYESPSISFVSNMSELLSPIADPEDEDLFVATVVLSFLKQTVTESTSESWQWRIFRTVGHSGGYLASISAFFAVLFVRRYPYSEIACTYEELTLVGFQSKEVDVEVNPYAEGLLESSHEDDGTDSSGLEG